MDLRQLAALAAVADHHSFSAAARALHTVQSNVSAHVARLERELYTVLVDRSTGTLTDTGELVVARYRRIRAELDALTADVASVEGEVAGSVRLGLIGTVGRWLAPDLLRSVTAAHPKLRVVIVDATTTSLVPQLSAGTLDLAVVNLPVTDPDVDTQVLFEEDHILVAPVGHPLAAYARVGPRELAAHPLLLEPPGTGFRDDLDVDAARFGQTLVAAAEVDGMRLVATLAFRGELPALLPASALPEGSFGPGAEPADQPWVVIDVDGFTPRRVGLAVPRRSNLSAPARAVRDVLVDVLGELVPQRPRLRSTAG